MFQPSPYSKDMASITTPRHNLENDKLRHKDLTKVKIITTPNQNIILGDSDHNISIFY
jgi:hypothetical protein